MIRSFLQYLEFEKRFSRHTLLSYQTDLRQWEEYLNSSGTGIKPEDADYSSIRSWLIHLIESGIQARSVNRKIATLRSFYKFLNRQEVITRDPMRKVKVMKTKKTLPYFIRESDMIRMLDSHEYEDSLEGMRDKLILEILYGTGIRLSEMIGLKTANVNFQSGTIKVLGKRNKERIIPINQELGRLMKEYSDRRNAEMPENGNPHFIVNNEGGECYPMMVYRTVKKYLDIFTSVEKRSPHVLRHSFATHLLNKGADLNAVKDLLGHTSLAATQVYTHNSLEKLKEEFDQAHPKA